MSSAPLSFFLMVPSLSASCSAVRDPILAQTCKRCVTIYQWHWPVLVLMLLALNWAHEGNSYLHFSVSKQEKQLGTRRWFCLLLPTRRQGDASTGFFKISWWYLSNDTERVGDPKNMKIYFSTNSTAVSGSENLLFNFISQPTSFNLGKYTWWKNTRQPHIWLQWWKGWASCFLAIYLLNDKCHIFIWQRAWQFELWIRPGTRACVT